MSNDLLERRYRLLLHVYPAGYRRERGDEVLETVLASEEPAREWPSPRQAAALMLGGLRARQSPTQGPAGVVTWWQAIELSAIALVAYAGAIIGRQVLESLETRIVSGYTVSWLAQNVAAATSLAALLVALIVGYRRTAVGLVLVAIVAPTALNPHPLTDDWNHVEWWAPIVALPMILAGAGRPASVPNFSTRSRAGLLATCALAIGLATTKIGFQTIFFGVGRPLVIVAVLAMAAVMYGVIDPRPLIAIAAVAAPGLITTVADALRNGVSLESLDRVGLIARITIVAGALGWAAVTTQRRVRV